MNLEQRITRRAFRIGHHDKRSFRLLRALAKEAHTIREEKPASHEGDAG